MANNLQNPSGAVEPEYGSPALAERCLDSRKADMDWPAIDNWLAHPGANRLDACRQLLNSANAALQYRFLQGEAIERLVEDRARLVDRVIVSVWHDFQGQNYKDIALVAVGGYGRGELHPCSDIDLLLLTGRDIRKERETIAAFLAFLWDIGLEVGHSTRTVADCRSACKNDLTIVTTLMESRLLFGPEPLYANLVKAIAPPDIWPSRAFFEAKLKEQQARHLRYDDTAYTLEPNIKGSPGGLRDIQIILWVTSRHFGTSDLSSLVKHDFLTEAQLRLLRDGRRFLWRIRFALHMFTGRREDRLLFDYQTRIAKLFGYEDATYTLAVEQLMQRYYRTAMDISRLNEMLLQLFQEAILLNPNATPEPISADFESRNGFLQAAHDEVFSNNPSALLEMFLLLQQHPELKGVSAKTIALLRRHLHLIDDEFRMNPRNHRLFLQILAAPEGVTHELRRMNAYGVLGQYIPNFGRIVGRMQYDLFHAYTVDAHTLFVVSNLRRFALKRFDHEFPRCSEIMQSIGKQEIAYLAGLFHDIAKGQGGDHSELGAVSAEAFCLEHGMSRYDSRLVAWLVRNHLKLSLTAQKKDINDPEVIREFAQLVGDDTHLDYLYLLTVADVRATNPKLWNSWKAQIIDETYELTKRALRYGLTTPIDKDELLREKRTRALDLLKTSDISAERAIALWTTFGEEYLLRCKPDEIAWHTSLLANFDIAGDETLLEIYTSTATAGTIAFIYAPQRQFTFALATAALDEFGLSIADARIIPLANEHSLSMYTILEQDGQSISDEVRREKIRQRLAKAIRSDSEEPGRVTRKIPRQARMFSTPTVVEFGDDLANNRTVMELTTGDKPGLLAQTAQVLRSQGMLMRMAKIVTVGERAEDVFYILNSARERLTSEQQDALRVALKNAIDNNA